MQGLFKKPRNLKKPAIYLFFIIISSIFIVGDIITNYNDPVTYSKGDERYIKNDFRAYGEIWNRTSGGFTFTPAASEIYYNVTGAICGNLKNFNCTIATQANGGTYLTALQTGIYRANAHISGEGTQAGGEYGIIISRNFFQLDRDCYVNVEGVSSEEVISITCIMNVTAGDKINLQVDDETDPPKAFSIHTINLNLIRIDER